MGLSTIPQGNTAQSNLMITYYKRTFLEFVKKVVRMYPLSYRDPFPKFTGRTVQFERYVPLDLVTETLTETTVLSGQQDFSVLTVSATLQEFGRFTYYTRFLQMTSVDPNLKGLMELYGEQAAITIDYFLGREVAVHGNFAIRPDNETTYEQQFTHSGAATSTTKIMCPSGGGVSQTGITTGAHVTCFAGTNYGWAGRVDLSLANTSVATSFTVVPAAPASFDSTSQIRVVSTASLTEADVVTTAAMRKALKFSRINALKPYDDGFLRGLFSPYTMDDFMKDTTWVNAAQYQNNAKLENGEIGKWMGIRVIDTTQPIRENWTHDTANESAIDMTDGGIFHNPIMGKRAVSSIELAGMKPEIIVKNPGPQTTGDPMNRRSSIAWKSIHTAKSTNACWVIDILSGATGETLATS